MSNETNDLASLTGAPRLLKVGGEEHKVYPFALEDFGHLQAWVDSQFVDPVDLTTLAIDRGRLVIRDGKPCREAFPVAQQQAMIRNAQELAARGRRLIGTPEADEKVQSLDGIKEVLFLSIWKGNPKFTREDATRLHEKMTYGDIARVFEATEVEKVVPHDPKDGTPGGTTPETTIPDGTVTP